jgi:thiamine phosphate synthase YjbQ (UPF0047 family)
VFINDDESGLHHDYEVWLERLASHAPIDQAGPEAGCTTGRARTPVRPGQVADAHLKWQIMGREVVVAVTEGRLDGSTEGFD